MCLGGGGVALPCRGVGGQKLAPCFLAPNRGFSRQPAPSLCGGCNWADWAVWGKSIHIARAMRSCLPHTGSYCGCVRPMLLCNAAVSTQCCRPTLPWDANVSAARWGAMRTFLPHCGVLFTCLPQTGVQSTSVCPTLRHSVYFSAPHWAGLLKFLPQTSAGLCCGRGLACNAQVFAPH